MRSDAAAWAYEEFGSLEAGDSRRVKRVLNMATRAAETPAGKVSEVFKKDRERQGAYDLLEGKRVSVQAVGKAVGNAAAERAAKEPFAYVAVDGCSITLTDREQTKGFGRVGNKANALPSQGLHVINALGLTPHGIPLGFLSQAWWARGAAPVRQGTARERSTQKTRYNRHRSPEEKETRYWLQAIEEATEQADESGAQLWFLLDREADCQPILMKLCDSNHQFTVRGAWNRVTERDDETRENLRPRLARKPVQAVYELSVPSGPKRAARRARMVVRWSKVVLYMVTQPGPPTRLELTAVWTQERRTCPKGEKPLDWLLLTSAEVHTAAQAREVIDGYAFRWRVECVHKTWKTGACSIEDTQLRSRHATIVWATLLAAVAARIERLKLLSRSEPEQPASVELDPYEIRALILLKRENKKKTETVPDSMPTIGQATRWIADLGGYTGRSSGGPPGAITIRRGLEYITPAAQLLRQLELEK